MSYALFLVILIHGGQSVYIDGFGSAEACHKAGQMVARTVMPKDVGTMKREDYIRWTCIPKGSKHYSM